MAVTSPSLSWIHLASSITDRCTTCCSSSTATHHCGPGDIRNSCLYCILSTLSRHPLSFMSLSSRVQSQQMWSQGFGWAWEAIQVSQQRETINSGITTRGNASWRLMGGWLKEARPDNWSSHSPGPWQRALSHRTPVKPGGQWHRWWWWHVPPFWQRSIALSHTRAAETKQKGREDRKGWLIDHSVIGRRRTSTGKFAGHKLPLLVLSASIYVRKAQLTH